MRSVSRTLDLQEIPSVGPSLAPDLYDLGMHRVEDLRGADPERLYKQLLVLRGHRIDPCVLYVFRCAAYYASNRKHDPELLKWWNWKDSVDSAV